MDSENIKDKLTKLKDRISVKSTKPKENTGEKSKLTVMLKFWKWKW